MVTRSSNIIVCSPHPDPLIGLSSSRKSKLPIIIIIIIIGTFHDLVLFRRSLELRELWQSEGRSSMVLLQVLERWHALLSETTTKLRAAKAALQGPVWALA